MIDMHSHILFDIDDGSRSKDMSLAMLQMAVAGGTTHIVATPHVNRRGVVPAWDVIQSKVTALQADAKEAGIPITIHAGAEVEINYEALQFLPEGGNAYCLAGTRYILCELTNQSEPKQTEELLFELTMRGYRPILAHPERYDRIMEHPETITKWVEKGILLQCNGGSFVGYFGDTVQKRVERLAEQNLISFLGSDAHRTEIRHPDLTGVHQFMETKPYGPKLWQLCETNGQKLLAKKAIYATVLEKQTKKPKKKSFWQKLFG